MKTKRNTRSRVSDVLILFFCLGGSTLSLYLFWNDLHTTYSKFNEKPVASITFKYKVAQRKFMDRLIWDRLQQNTPIYNGDTIRTAEHAQATVHFTDNNKIDLGANSIIQVFVDKTGLTSVDFAGGDLYVDSREAAGGIKLRSGTASVNLAPGAALAAAVTSSSTAAAGQTAGGTAKINLQLVAGSATYTGKTGAASQILQQGDGIVLDEKGTIREQPVSVISPLNGALYLKQRKDLVPVNFSWKTGTLPENSSVILETAGDKDFNTLEEQIAFTGIKTITVDMPAGTRYWRLYVREAAGTIADNSIVSGKVQILDAPQPSPIVPAAADTFAYRTKLPSIRFMWNGNEFASSYLFEIADNPQMNNPAVRRQIPQTSAIISSLSDSRWYWRVTPVYSMSGGAEGIPSAISFFDITQSGKLTAPQLTAPADNSFINTASGAAGQKAQTMFSWKHNPEAVSYTVKIAKNQTLTDSLIVRETGDNWFSAIPANDGITNGRWYWAVSCTDSEGNISVFSPTRSFAAVNGELVFHAVFPPDGYHIADSRVRDMRFTWKKNFDDAVRLQIARTPDFEKPVYNDLLSASAVSADGKNLAIGVWYWRLASVSPDGDLTYKTDARRLTVEPPLSAPIMTFPSAGERVTVKPGQPLHCYWQPAAGADYYQIALYRDGSDVPLFQEQLDGGTPFSVPTVVLSDGEYRLTVQAFASETAFASRRSGQLTETLFTLKKIFPAQLVFPPDKTVFDGLEAILDPAEIEWGSIEVPERTEFILARSKNALPAAYGGTSGAVIYRLKNPNKLVSLPPLREGTYWWTVTAQTDDGFDMSAEQPFSFTVQPIPPLPAAGGLKPAAGTVFDTAYLSKTTAATLSWKTVPGADTFELTLYRTGDGSSGQERTAITRVTVSAATLSYTIADLGELDEGNFIWTVEAQSHTDNGELLQHGRVSQADFAITLPPIHQIQLTPPGELYGN